MAFSTRKRPLTPEQQAASAARRQRLREVSKQIAVLDDETRLALAQRMHLRTCDGHPLSIVNACMVALQHPSATIVGGLRQWRKHGRKVRLGEHGCSIWVPKKPLEGNTGLPEADSMLDERRFLLVTVFDVSQTDEE